MILGSIHKQPGASFGRALTNKGKIVRCKQIGGRARQRPEDGIQMLVGGYPVPGKLTGRVHKLCVVGGVLNGAVYGCQLGRGNRAVVGDGRKDVIDSIAELYRVAQGCAGLVRPIVG